MPKNDKDTAGWQPGASREALQQRSSLYQQIRIFFSDRGVLEVETPLLAACGVTDPHIHSIAVPDHGWLQPSPEYHMKRLLAAGSGPIFQITRSFRAGESGQRHNPEFSILEWYRPGFLLNDLVDECLQLLSLVLDNPPHQQLEYRLVFANATGLDPLTASTEQLASCAREYAGSLPGDMDRAALADLLMAVVVEPALPCDKITVIRHFPGWAASLSETFSDSDGQTLARRFEIYYAGLELANGYQELLDSHEQQKRFARDNSQRQKMHLPVMPVDQRLLEALDHGLPQCSGVAMGLDRLLMVQQGIDDIAQAITFARPRA